MAICKLGEKGCWKDGKCYFDKTCDNKVLSNGDRIRAMTDEELAMIMVQLTDLDARIPFCQELPECEALLDTEDGIPAEKCAVCMRKWLKQPAEVDNG